MRCHCPRPVPLLFRFAHTSWCRRLFDFLFLRCFFLCPPESAAEVDQSTCPEPCTGHIITYYWSISPGSIHFLDRASTDADPTPCWLPVLYEIQDGPPVEGVTEWNPTCMLGLLEAVEESKYDEGSGGDDATDGGGGGGSATVLAAVIIPVALVCFIGLAFLFMRCQRVRRVKKMRTTDEAWGQGLDGRGGMPEKQAVASASGATVAAEGEEQEQGGGGGGAEVAERKRKSFSPPKRAFTDISMEDNEDDLEAAVEGGGSGGEESDDGLGVDDAIYPMDV